MIDAIINRHLIILLFLVLFIWIWFFWLVCGKYIRITCRFCKRRNCPNENNKKVDCCDYSGGVHHSKVLGYYNLTAEDLVNLINKKLKNAEVKKMGLLDDFEDNWHKYLIAIGLGWLLKDNKTVKKALNKVRGEVNEFLEEPKKKGKKR